MLQWRKKIRLFSYIGFDILSIWFALILTKPPYLRYIEDPTSLNALELFGLFSLAIFTYVGLFIVTNVYEDTIHTGGNLNFKIAAKMFLSYFFGSISIYFILFSTDAVISSLHLIILIIYIIIAQLLSRLLLRLVEFSNEEATQGVKNILVVGSSAAGNNYINEIKKYDYLNIHVIGYVKIDDKDINNGLKCLGTSDDLEHIVVNHVVDELAVVRPLSSNSRLKDKLNQCQSMGITTTMVLELQNTDISKVHVAMVGSTPVLKFHIVSLNENQLLIKRFMDVCGAALGMVLFGISFIIFAPLIAIESRGPIIFKQDRVGKNGRVFKVLKYRSMTCDADAQKAQLMSQNEMNGQMFKMTNDPRITKIGAFLRKSSIDEIPQFYNVLKGDMSLVGTRPPTLDEVKEYEDAHRCRLSITPGITGMWQVSGRSNIQDFKEVVQLDVKYISNWSIWLDVKIILKTIAVVFIGRGSK